MIYLTNSEIVLLALASTRQPMTISEIHDIIQHDFKIKMTYNSISNALRNNRNKKYIFSYVNEFLDQRIHGYKLSNKGKNRVYIINKWIEKDTSD